jgi:hypothetical protein
MKPLWTQTLTWILAVVAAVILALLTPGELSLLMESGFSHGAFTPR